MIAQSQLDSILENIDLNLNPPATEPERQYYFLKKLQQIVKTESEKIGHPLTACSVVFGCQMNARDSEKLEGILKNAGFVLNESEEADLVIYNTCTVRDNANTRVYGRLGYIKALKKKQPHKKVALCGCMMQEEAVIENIKKNYRFVNLVFGTHNIFKFAELLVSMYESDSMIIDIWKDTNQIVEDLPVERKFTFKTGINIMFGCNNFCSYCIVPYVRGRERSRKPKEIIREIEKYVADGVIEIMLLGQNVNSYGKDLEEKVTFTELLAQIEQIEGLERIRFMTPHPKDFSLDLIEYLKTSKKVCKHIHLPIQSGSTKVLKEMNRRYTKEQYLELAFKIRKELPDFAITTDIIVGFPGETHEDVLDTIDVIRQVQYENAFTFIYSKRTGTPAAAREDQVPEELVKKHFDEVLNAVHEVSAKRTGLYTGEVHSVLVEEMDGQNASYVTGKMSNNTTVHFPGTEQLIGKIVDVHLKECKGFYYIGERVAD